MTIDQRVAIQDLNPGDFIKYDNDNREYVWVGINGIAVGINGRGTFSQFAVDMIRPDLPDALTRTYKGELTRQAGTGND